VDHNTEERYYIHEKTIIKCLYKNYDSKDSFDQEEKSSTTPTIERECDDSYYKDLTTKYFKIIAVKGKDIKEDECIWE